MNRVGFKQTLLDLAWVSPIPICFLRGSEGVKNLASYLKRPFWMTFSANKKLLKVNLHMKRFVSPILKARNFINSSHDLSSPTHVLESQLANYNQ